MSYEKDKKDLITQIHLAFKRIKYPKNGMILNSPNEEWELEDFTDRHWNWKDCLWQAISLQMVKKNHAALSFGTPVFYQWIIPAYMVHSIENLFNREVGYQFVDQTVLDVSCVVIIRQMNKLKTNITENDRNEAELLLKHCIQRRCLFSEEQKMTFKSFLELIVTHSNNDVYIEHANVALEGKYYLL